MRSLLHVALLLAAMAVESDATDTLGAFEARAQIKMRLTTTQTAPLDLNEINVIEAATAQYFDELLKNPSYEAFPELTQVASTHVSVTQSSLVVDSIQSDADTSRTQRSIQTEADISVTHLGLTGIDDLAVILLFVTNLNVTGASYTSLNGLIGDIGVEVSNLSFVAGSTTTLSKEVITPAASNASKYSDSEILLITVCSVLSFALLVMSGILIWVGGGWLALRKQVKVLIHREEELSRMFEEKQHQVIQERPTVDADEESQISRENETHITNASGMLGVSNPYRRQGRANSSNDLDGLGVKTPSRIGQTTLDDSGIYTPTSEATTYSDTNRVPLGITSMRKLLPTAAAADEEQDGLDHLNNFHIQKLEF